MTNTRTLPATAPRRRRLTGAALAATALAAGTIAGIAPAAAAPDVDTSTITIDGSSEGRTYDGIGAISGGGATSRLLLDYPEEERAEVLDYLFTPGYGASLQMLKVEIGGDTNSTDGSESSHQHVRDEINCNAGYEWWLMEEAVERNPDINLGGLAWGAPGWLSENGYYSQDTIDYFINWLDCAGEHGLTIDNMGIRNEREYDAEWIKLYRQALDAAGYDDVRIIASDEAAVRGEWPIAVDMANDPELFDAVDLLGNHYSRGPSSETAQSLGKPLWISEGGPWSAVWGKGGSSASVPSLLNHAYIDGRITSVTFWNLLTAYYDGLSISDAGLMRANTPWSGAYQVQSAMWAVAQTTQFAEPGWRYLDDSSAYFDPEAKTEGSYVTRRAPEGDAWSTVIETIEADGPREVTLRVENGLAADGLSVWRSSAEEKMVRQADPTKNADGSYTITVPADSVVTVTTTSGQGFASEEGSFDSAFPFPYRDDLADGGPSGQTPYFSQMEGAYEIRACADGREGTCLTQVAPQPAISWAAWKKPTGIIGDLNWSDYRVGVDSYVPEGGETQVLGRVSNDAMQPVPNGYGLSLAADGGWSIGRGEPGGRSWLELASGSLEGAGSGWHRLEIAFDEDRITGSIDGEIVGEVSDATWTAGMAGLSGDYSAAQYADLAIEPLDDMVVFDDAHDAISYDGDWRHCSAAAGGGAGGACRDVTGNVLRDAAGGTLSTSTAEGDSAEFVFSGTQATIIGLPAKRAGVAEISIDGNEPETVPFGRGESVWRTPVLIDGEHTLRVVNVSGSVSIDEITVAPGNGGPSSVDDRSVGIGDGRFDFQGEGWYSCPGCINRTGLYHSSVTSTTVPGDFVDFRFHGSSIDVYGLRASNQGLATVLIDGEEVGVADFWGQKRVGNQLIWSSPDLEPGEHTLTLVVRGEAGENGSGTEVSLDRVVVTP